MDAAHSTHHLHGPRVHIKQRSWSTRRKMTEAYIAYLLGPSNTLRFGALLRENEAVFLFPLTISIVLIGIPLAYMEVGLGHYTLQNVAHIWRMCPCAKGLFYVTFLSTLATALYMTLFLCYAMHFMVASLEYELPWSKCSPKWAKENCFELGLNTSAQEVCAHNHNNTDYCKNLVWEASSLHYWKEVVLEKSPVFGYLTWTVLLYLFIICLIITMVNYKGIRSLEKSTEVFAYVPMVCLFILMFIILCLPGAVKYLKMFWILNWSKLSNASVWLGSIDVVFLSLGLGSLGLNFISSHGHFRDNILIDVIAICLLDLAGGFLFSFFVFGLKGGFLHHEEISRNIDIEPSDFTRYFVWISQAVISKDYPEKWLALIFYFSAVVSVLSSLSILLACLNDAVIGFFHKFGHNVFYVSAVNSTILFILALMVLASIGIYFPSIETSLATIALLEAIIIQWIYGCHNITDDFHFMMGYRPSLFFRVLWALSPILLLGFLFAKFFLSQEKLLVKYTFIGIPIAVYFIGTLAEILMMYKKGTLQSFWQIFKQDYKWGPSASILKKSRIIFNSQAVTKEYIYRQELFKRPYEKPYDFSKQNIVQPL